MSRDPRQEIPSSQAKLHGGPYYIMGKKVGAPEPDPRNGVDGDGGADEPEPKGWDHPALRY